MSSITGPPDPAGWRGRRRGRCPTVSQRPLGLGDVVVVPAISRCWAFSSVTDWKIGSRPNSGSPGEVHLRDQPLGERGPEQREVDVRRTPGVVVVAPRVGARLDRREAVAALVVGQRAAAAGEVRVERRGVLVAVVAVATGGVGLPDLDELVAHRAPVAVEDPARDHDALAQRLADVLAGEVGVERRHVGRAEHRSSELDEARRRHHQRPRRRPQGRAPVRGDRRGRDGRRAAAAPTRPRRSRRRPPAASRAPADALTTPGCRAAGAVSESGFRPPEGAHG